MMICENCGKEHDGTYGNSGRFCSRYCQYAFPTKYISKFKIANCIECGKVIKIHINSSSKTCKCIKCKQNIKHNCKICGQEFIGPKNKTICNNKFCISHNIQQFKSLIKYFGFDQTKFGTLEVENEFNRIKNTLYDLYWNKHLSSRQICEIYNYPNVSNLTAKIFTYLEIPHKTVKECTIENYLENRLTVNNHISSNINYIQQWHTTWNGKKVFLRSSYELDYAKELDRKQIDYEVEFKHIKYWDSQKQEYRCAIPDFYIPKDNMIVEIKSNWTLDKQNMIDKKKAYLEQGYNFKLICEHQEQEI